MSAGGIFYTQLIFLKAQQDQAFQEFENLVLPLLEKHSGKLLYRVRPSAEDVVESSIGKPYEIHLIRFESKRDFESYRDDPDRKQHAPLKEKSVEKAVLIEGIEIR